MKKLTIGIVVVLCVLLMGCFDIQLGNSINGTWVGVMAIDTHMGDDTTYYNNGYMYHPEVDQYYFAQLYTFTDEELIYYGYLSDNSFITDTLAISLTADSLYLISDDLYFEYYFSNDRELVLRREYSWSDDNGTHTDISEQYFQRYKGNIPPDSWSDPIEEDKYEPDNILSNASKVKIGLAQSHSFTVNDTDYCYFEAVEGQAYLIQGLSYLEIECALLDKNGNVIMTDSDNDLSIAGLGDEVETVIAWECPVSGKYYLMFKGEDSRGLFSSGFYQIKVEKCDIDDLEYGGERQVYGKKVFEFGSKFMKKFQTK